MKVSSLPIFLILWCAILANGYNRRNRYQNPITQTKTTESSKEIESCYLNSPALHIASGGSTQLRRKDIPRVLDHALIPIATHLTIAYFALKEISEVGKTAIGHAHGLASLALVNLLSLFAEFQTQVEEINEGVEEIGEVEWRLLTVLRRMLLSPLLSMSASVFAVAASVIEILKDLMPGGHHGMALLALSTFQFQFRRYQRIKNQGKSFHKTPDSAFVYWIKHAIPISAALFACYELYNDLKPGAHHGVPLMALSEMIENIYRARD